MTHSQPTPGFEWKHREDPYGTHQPVLYEAIKRSTWDDPILELGCGFNSTDLIHAIAGNKIVLTHDHNESWINRFKERLESETHKFHVRSLEDMPFLKRKYSVIFVDQGDWESRAKTLKFMAHGAELIVLHDSDYLEREGLIQFKDHFKYFKTFMPLQPYPYMTGPPTTIMSNFVDVTTWEINYEDYK